MMNDNNKSIIDTKFFVALLENSGANIKKFKIINCIENGADVNVRFRNYANNTPLHLAVIQGDRELVNILLTHSARADIKNDDGKTASEVAKELPERSDISEIFAAWQEPTQKEDAAGTVDTALTPGAMSTYKKRPGTANVRGQLYETKLLTLIYLRAARCRQITQFYMGTNVDEIGDMDDVCLRFKTLNDDCMIFLQAKHKDNIVKGRVGIEDLWRTSGDFSLLKYFGSYRKIRDKFSLNSEDKVFRGRFEIIKCYYLIYTTIKDDLECDLKQSAPYDKVTDLVGTGEQQNIFQLKYNDQFIDLLTKTLMIEHIKSMGQKLFKLIQNNKHDMMLCDKNIRSFHVVLAQQVIKVSEVNSEGRRTGTFREEFFLSSNDEILTALKETLYEQAAINNKPRKDEIDKVISKIFNQPEAETISELIGSVLVYDSNTNTLKIKDEKRHTHNSLLSRLQLPQSVINEAYAIAGRKQLGSLTFNLPAAFGNLDMTVTANKKKAERRLEFLADKISDVIKESADAEGYVKLREGVYGTDKHLEAGVLAINGGVAGAVGNLLVPGDKNELKFNLDDDTLGVNARNLLLKLKDRHTDLHKYRFIPIDEEFPRLSMCATKDEKSYVLDFLDNLYFCTFQAKEDQLEEIVTKELQTYECSDSINKAESRIRSNALFLKVHNVIQIWWMTEQTVPYLSRNTFDKIFREFVNKGLLSFLNFIYLNELNNVGLEFDSHAVEVLSVCRRDIRDLKTIIVRTDVPVLTCHKLVQLFRDTECYIFLDIDYLSRITPHCLEMITEELAETNIRNVVIVSKDISKCNAIIQACGSRQVILVTSNNYVSTKEYIFVKDDKINFTDLTQASQSRLIQTKFSYQGIGVTFAEVFEKEMKQLINSKVLEKIINKEYITIGQPLTQSTYEEIKHYYVPRTLQYNLKSCNTGGISQEDVKEKSFRSETSNKYSHITLIDHHDPTEEKIEKAHDVVLLLDAPGMGKSTLLTHLSLETKKRYPNKWIQRINLIDHSKQFHDWHENKIKMDNEEALKFICKIVLTKESSTGSIRVADNNIIDLELINGEMNIKGGNDNLLSEFTLKMFLNCFKNGQTVLLFDGFDEICPHYKTKVMQLLKCLARFSAVNEVPEVCSDMKRSAPRIWVTSRPYNELRQTLEKEFGESYTLQPFSFKDICAFVEKYMKRNLNLKVMTHNQFKNVDGFFKYMKRCRIGSSTNFNKVLECVYVAAAQYLETKIHCKQLTLTDVSSIYIKDWIQILKEHNTLRSFWNQYLSQTEELPLHVYFTIHNFVSQVKDTTLTDTEELIQQWDMETSTIVFYERFIETKLKTIRFEEKNRLNIYHPDIRLTYEKEKKEFLDKHKKLAFFIICKQNHSMSMLTGGEQNEIKDIIRRMKVGEEKTGLIDSIVNGMPRFIHFTFVEYFAMEYIVNSLKYNEQPQQHRMLHFILFTVFILPSCVLFYFLNLKIKSNPALLTHLNYFFFDWLVKQPYHYCAFLYETILNDLRSLTNVLIDGVINSVNESNFDDFTFTIKPSFFSNAFPVNHEDYNELVSRILNCIRKHDNSKIVDLYNKITSDITDCTKTSGKTNEDIIKEIRRYHERKGFARK